MIALIESVIFVMPPAYEVPRCALNFMWRALAAKHNSAHQMLSLLCHFGGPEASIICIISLCALKCVSIDIIEAALSDRPSMAKWSALASGGRKENQGGLEKCRALFISCPVHEGGESSVLVYQRLDARTNAM